MSDLALSPLTPLIGAEVHGVQLADLDAEVFAQIEQAWAQHLVLFFRDQELDVESHVAFARRLGEPHVHPASPTVEGHPEAMIIHADEKSKYVAGHGWHTDVSCDARPPAASILYLIQVPECGGDTLFSNMYEAYERLSKPMKAFLEPLRAVHESGHVYGNAYGHSERDSRDGEFPRAEHPVIRTHPVTGRKAVYVNRAFTTRIRGLRRAESDALLQFLFTHCEQPELQCRFRWRPKSLALWDNRCAQHHAMWDYHPQVRSGVRVSVVGEVPR